MAIRNEIIDELLQGKDPKTVLSSDGLMGELKKVLAERILNAEMPHIPSAVHLRVRLQGAIL